MRTRIAALGLLALAWPGSTHATFLVAAMEPGAVVIAADGGIADSEGRQTGTACKIRVLDNALLAQAGLQSGGGLEALDVAEAVMRDTPRIPDVLAPEMAWRLIAWLNAGADQLLSHLAPSVRERKPIESMLIVWHASSEDATQSIGTHVPELWVVRVDVFVSASSDPIPPACLVDACERPSCVVPATVQVPESRADLRFQCYVYNAWQDSTVAPGSHGILVLGMCDAVNRPVATRVRFWESHGLDGASVLLAREVTDNAARTHAPIASACLDAGGARWLEGGACTQ